MPRVQRWYKGFSYLGNPKSLVDTISEQIQRQNLCKFIPVLRVEKGAKSRRQFYFFLAIESACLGEIPTEIQSTLLRLQFFQSPIRGSASFTYEEIKSMVGTAHDVYDYTNPIPYQPVQITYDNPFDWIASPPVYPPLTNIEALSHRYEQLLYWLSALGSGTWESFKKACDALSLEEPKRILRRLKLLGHIETSLDGSQWSTAPTAFVKVRSHSDQKFILCGQRSMNLLQKLETHLTMEFSKQPRGEAPPCVCLQVAPNTLSNMLEQVSHQFTITNAGEVSNQMARILPDIATWKQSLRSLQGIVPSLYEWKRFDGNNFISCISPNQTGMYQMWTTDCDRPRYTLFYDQEIDSWQQGDWYGLRFLALQHSGQKCVIHYDSVTERLAIPVSQRWPELYERALVLASGRLPTYQDSWLLYEVGLEVVQQLSYKLNVKCEEASTRA